MAIGTWLKNNFFRDVLLRIPDMARDPSRYWRAVLFASDEYHIFAKVGATDLGGDEKVLSQSRQAKLMPFVSAQSISSFRSTLPGETWRTLLQTFRTKVFLSLSDDFSARVASDLCGRSEQLRPQYSVSESGQDANVSLLTGRPTARRASMSASKSYHTQMLPVFEPKVFMELGNAQAIVLAYDGDTPQPPTRCYLKPHYLDRDTSYFEQVARGQLA